MPSDWSAYSGPWHGPIDMSDHLGFLLAEDEAIKKYLTGLTVPNKSGTSDVKTWFRWPTQPTKITYPFITIDFLDAQPSYDRWTSKYRLNATTESGSAEFLDPVTGQLIRKGLYQPSVSPSVLPPEIYDADLQNLDIEQYLMYTLLYQVTVHTRDWMHDRFLQSRFMTDVFPPRPFWIGVDADSTWRRAELLEVMSADTLETTESPVKRVFRKVYTISMDAEIPTSIVAAIAKVFRVHIDLYGSNPIAFRELVTHRYDDVHAAAEPVNVVPDA